MQPHEAFCQAVVKDTACSCSCGSGTFSRTVSPRNSCSVSMVAGFSATTELSSLMASSTYRRLAAFLRSRMAVLKSYKQQKASPDSTPP